jgi:effector-binding domain-containing protein
MMIHVRAERLTEAVERATAWLARHARANGAIPGSAFPQFVGPVTVERDGPVEICVPVDMLVEPGEGMRLSVLPATRAVRTSVSGSRAEYPKVLDAYAALCAWMGERALHPAGPPRERSSVGGGLGGTSALSIVWPISTGTTSTRRS